MVHTCNFSTLGAEEDDSEFKACLGHIVKLSQKNKKKQNIHAKGIGSGMGEGLRMFMQ